MTVFRYKAILVFNQKFMESNATPDDLEIFYTHEGKQLLDHLASMPDETLLSDVIDRINSYMAEEKFPKITEEDLCCMSRHGLCPIRTVGDVRDLGKWSEMATVLKDTEAPVCAGMSHDELYRFVRYLTFFIDPYKHYSSSLTSEQLTKQGLIP